MQEFTILELSDKMRSGELTCYRIVSNYLDLIRVYDPPLRSVIEINPDAFELAKACDAELSVNNGFSVRDNMLKLRGDYRATKSQSIGR